MKAAIRLTLIGKLRGLGRGASPASSIALRLATKPVSAVQREMLERDDEMRRLRTILRQIQLTHQAKGFSRVKDVRHRQILSCGVAGNGFSQPLDQWWPRPRLQRQRESELFDQLLFIG